MNHRGIEDGPPAGPDRGATNALTALANRWRADAELLDRYGDVRGAAVARLHAADLDEAAAEMADELLSLEDAANESGYSTRRLRELITAGEIPQAGRKGSPRIRRRDLPRKPGSASALTYDPQADAAGLISRMAS